MWEYTGFTAMLVEDGKVITSVPAAFEHLDELGREGWELISVTPIIDNQYEHGGYSKALLYTLKRPITASQIP